MQNNQFLLWKKLKNTGSAQLCFTSPHCDLNATIVENEWSFIFKI